MARWRYKSRKKKAAAVYRVDPNQLAEALSSILDTYEFNIVENVKEATDAVTDDTTERLKTTSPARRPREYANNWTWTNLLDSSLSRIDAVYNKGRTYRLIHLLEWGHVIRNQYSGNHYDTKIRDYVKGKAYGRVAGRPHLMPAVEYAKEIYPQKVKEAIKNAAE